MKRSSFLVFILCLLTSFVFAQEVRYKKTLGYDSTYISKYDKYLTLTPVIDVLFYDLEFSSKNDESMMVSYAPNLRPLWGMGFGYRWLYFELTTSKGFETSEDGLKGNTRKIGISGAITKQKWATFGYISSFKGMYLSNPDIVESNYVQKHAGNYPLRDDLSMLTFRLTAYYIFNYKKFSLAAGISSEAQRQNKSAGSFLTGFSVAGVHIDADSSVIPQSIAHGFTESDFVKSSRYYLLTFDGGYSHTFVFRRFFTNLGFTAGFGPVKSIIVPENENMSRNTVDIANMLDARLSGGYNSQHFYTGFNLSISYLSSSAPKEASIVTSRTNLRFFMGYRFKVNCYVPIIDRF